MTYETLIAVLTRCWCPGCPSCVTPRVRFDPNTPFTAAPTSFLSTLTTSPTPAAPTTQSPITLPSLLPSAAPAARRLQQFLDLPTVAGGAPTGLEAGMCYLLKESGPCVCIRRQMAEPLLTAL